MEFTRYISIQTDQGIALRPINDIYRDYNKGEWAELDAYANRNTFLFPECAEIGRVYQKEEVEVVTEFKDGYLPEWKKTICPGYHKDLDHPVRKIFRLCQQESAEQDQQSNRVMCDLCHGSGADSLRDGSIPCSKCFGTGSVDRNNIEYSAPEKPHIFNRVVFKEQNKVETETVEEASKRINPMLEYSPSYKKWNEGFKAGAEWQKKQNPT